MIRFWFTAWLCVFYCVKIVNSTHSLFLWCKMRISWLITRLLIGSLVFSCFASFFLLAVFPLEHENNKAANVTNMTQSKTLKDRIGPVRIFFYAVCSSSPIFVVLFCSIMVVASLCRHIYRMARTLQTKAHIKAATVVLSLLFLYVSFFVAQTLSTFVEVAENVKPFVSMVLIMYAPTQAAILIFSNPKLKQAFSQLLYRERSLEGQGKWALEIP
ncbi:taste receptor type 2 member 1-like [Sceloporus undulatus]|uniref:taste receptor type 2 member 1-like n=1 Tax=Sceloporus undulatus TaxID=8520 RepID=UPI001C4B968F|nr:taste receptor type 2 member 1-like [Sceloporus undulatus]